MAARISLVTGFLIAGCSGSSGSRSSFLTCVKNTADLFDEPYVESVNPPQGNIFTSAEVFTPKRVTIRFTHPVKAGALTLEDDISIAGKLTMEGGNIIGDHLFLSTESWSADRKEFSFAMSATQKLVDDLAAIPKDKEKCGMITVGIDFERDGPQSSIEFENPEADTLDKRKMNSNYSIVYTVLTSENVFPTITSVTFSQSGQTSPQVLSVTSTSTSFPGRLISHQAITFQFSRPMVTSGFFASPSDRVGAALSPDRTQLIVRGTQDFGLEVGLEKDAGGNERTNYLFAFASTDNAGGEFGAIVSPAKDECGAALTFGNVRSTYDFTAATSKVRWERIGPPPAGSGTGGSSGVPPRVAYSFFPVTSHQNVVGLDPPIQVGIIASTNVDSIEVRSEKGAGSSVTVDGSATLTAYEAATEGTRALRLFQGTLSFNNTVPGVRAFRAFHQASGSEDRIEVDLSPHPSITDFRIQNAPLDATVTPAMGDVQRCSETQKDAGTCPRAVHVNGFDALKSRLSWNTGWARVVELLYVRPSGEKTLIASGLPASGTHDFTGAVSSSVDVGLWRFLLVARSGALVSQAEIHAEVVNPPAPSIQVTLEPSPWTVTGCPSDASGSGGVSRITGTFINSITAIEVDGKDILKFVWPGFTPTSRSFDTQVLGEVPPIRFTGLARATAQGSTNVTVTVRARNQSTSSTDSKSVAVANSTIPCCIASDCAASQVGPVCHFPGNLSGMIGVSPSFCSTACTSDSQCAAGAKCNTFLGQCFYTCSILNPCPSGQTCLDGCCVNGFT